MSINYKKLDNADGETLELVEAEAWNRFAAAAVQSLTAFSLTPWVNAVAIADEMMAEFRKRFVPSDYVTEVDQRNHLEE